MTGHTIDNLLEASTISFPRPLSLEETEKLIDYVSINLPAQIITTSEYYKTRMPTKNSPKTGTLYHRRGTVKISGSITNMNNYSFDGFYTKNDSDDSSKINAIAFQIIPGYNLEEHRPEVKQLWSDVRNQVETYFQKH